MAPARPDETRHGVGLTSLDQPLFDGSGATKRALVDYLDAAADHLLLHLRGRPLSVIRARPGQAPFMQKNLPASAPDWIPTWDQWAASSGRTVRYPVCDDRPTLMWLANQRAVELHPTLFRIDAPDTTDVLVIDLDPAEGDDEFGRAAGVAFLARDALSRAGLDAAVKTSGAKGVHVVVPVEAMAFDDAAAATRALAARVERLDPTIATTEYVRSERGGKVFVDSTRSGGATVIAAFSPRARPGVPVSFPVGWEQLHEVRPLDFRIDNVVGLLEDGDPWRGQLPDPQPVPSELIEEGRAIPVARVAAMHEGRRRARTRGDGGE